MDASSSSPLENPLPGVEPESASRMAKIWAFSVPLPVACQLSMIVANWPEAS